MTRGGCRNGSNLKGFHVQNQGHVVAVLQPVLVPADLEGRRGSTDEGVVNVVSEVQLLSVEVGFGNFGAVSDALSPMVNASESESVKFVDQ
jgi:hypothetical protein